MSITGQGWTAFSFSGSAQASGATSVGLGSFAISGSGEANSVITIIAAGNIMFSGFSNVSERTPLKPSLRLYIAPKRNNVARYEIHQPTAEYSNAGIACSHRRN